MVMDSSRQAAVVFDRDSESVAGTVEEIYGQAVGDCVIREDGLLGFAPAVAKHGTARSR
jgi:hypothetical protein